MGARRDLLSLSGPRTHVGCEKNYQPRRTMVLIPRHSMASVRRRTMMGTPSCVSGTAGRGLPNTLLRRLDIDSAGFDDPVHGNCIRHGEDVLVRAARGQRTARYALTPRLEPAEARCTLCGIQRRTWSRIQLESSTGADSDGTWTVYCASRRRAFVACVSATTHAGTPVRIRGRDVESQTLYDHVPL